MRQGTIILGGFVLAALALVASGAVIGMALISEGWVEPPSWVAFGKPKRPISDTITIDTSDSITIPNSVLTHEEMMAFVCAGEYPPRLRSAVGLSVPLIGASAEACEAWLNRRDLQRLGAEATR